MIKALVTLSRWWRLQTRRAAAFKTRCSDARVDWQFSKRAIAVVVMSDYKHQKQLDSFSFFFFQLLSNRAFPGDYCGLLRFLRGCFKGEILGIANVIFFAGQMPFLSPSQQYESTEGCQIEILMTHLCHCGCSKLFSLLNVYV